MKSEVNLKENIENDTNVIPFAAKPKLQLITGGTGGGDGENWLGNLRENTIFVSRQKNPRHPPFHPQALDKFFVQKQVGTITELIMAMPDGTNQLTFCVPSLEFSRANQLFEVLAELHIDETKEEEDEEKEKE